MKYIRTDKLRRIIPIIMRYYFETSEGYINIAVGIEGKKQKINS